MTLPTAVLDGHARNGDVPEIDPAARPSRITELAKPSEPRLTRRRRQLNSCSGTAEPANCQEDGQVRPGLSIFAHKVFLSAP